MLSEFVRDNRGEIIERCRARVAGRMAPRPTEIENGIPIFLDELSKSLLSTLTDVTDGVAATTHGESLLRRGFTVGQVVHDYGDVCQTITELAIETKAPITTEEFQTLNMCLDNAISDAVSAFGRQHEIDTVERATEDLGFVAHELRNLIGTASLAFEALKGGGVGVGGSTGAVLERSLKGLRDLVDRSLSLVRLEAGVNAERIVLGPLIDEIEASTMMDANARRHRLSVERDDATAVVVGDRQILASIVVNLLQNAYKFTKPQSRVVLRTITHADHVQIEVEDECGGLASEGADAFFKPFSQRGDDRSGLGLGLAICQRGVEAMAGTIRVRDVPAQGCVVTVELPRVQPISSPVE